MKTSLTEREILPLKRADKRELVRAIRELEKRGWECIHPIIEVPQDNKIWNITNSSKKLEGVSMYSVYYTKMKKIN